MSAAPSLSPASSPQPFQLRAADGTPLTAHLYEAPGRAAAVALIAPAMGVPQRFYGPFASWLARQGIHALTFDYRGMGASRTAPLRAVEADVFTWAEQDAAAALAEVASVAPGLPRLWIGHSLGGQIVPFVPGHEALRAVFTVAVGSGYWRENAPALRRRVWLFWWGAVPLLTPLFGYFPGRRLGMVGDLPRGVIRQWRAWCLDPRYVVGVVPEAGARFAAVRAPIHALSFTDDEMMSEENTRSIHSFYPSEQVTHHRWSPSGVGVSRIGHFGFFRAEMEGPLWEAQLGPLLRGALG